MKSSSVILRDLTLLFLRLGFTAFGGPAAHIAMMREEIVRQRQWISDDEFMDLVGATNLIPGPNSTELAIHIGHRLGGWRGLLLAGSCFIFPAFLIVLAFAWAYVKFGSLPQVDSILYGIKPVMISIIAVALWNLAKSALKTRFLIFMGLLATVLGIIGIHELLVLFLVAIAVTLVKEWRRILSFKTNKNLPIIFPLSAMPLSTVATSVIPFSLSGIFLFFLKVGSVLFGSGYVLLAFLRADLVDRWGWLTESQLLDAVAVGQFTPGPVFTTATFIGYVIGDIPGAILATIGIFLPSFIFVAISALVIARLRESAIASAFLDGLNAASFALMAVVTYYLGKSSFTDIPAILITVVSLLLLLYTKIKNTWLIVAAGLAGYIIKHVF